MRISTKILQFDFGYTIRLLSFMSLLLGYKLFEVIRIDL